MISVKLLVHSIVGLLLVSVIGCGYFYPTNVRLEHGDEWGIPEKRDFRLTVGYYALPARKTGEEIDESLKKMLAKKMKKHPICPHGYKITKIGASIGGGYHYIEGLCNDLKQ